jgi:osmotically-inducible protein OsmY
MPKNNTEKQEKPGVTGKNQKGTSWFNSSEYLRQRDSIEKVDESEKSFAFQNSSKIEEKEIFEALKRSPEIDAADVRVYVEGEIVTLAGSAENAEEARAMGKIVQNIPGVSKVIDHLYVRRGSKLQ